MFDSEEAHICLNAIYESGVQDDTFALLNEANILNIFAVKTPNGLNETRTISNKIMQADVLGNLMSSNMVDTHIGKEAIKSGIIYMYKEKVPIPPLMMQDDTLGVSKCGFKSQVMNTFFNTRTSIMNLQFGSTKCEKVHIGKKHNEDICPTLFVDSWKEEVHKKDNIKELKDIFKGKTEMKLTKEKKYLGDIICEDGTNKINIKDRTNKAIGNVNRIDTTLKERYFGKHMFKAAKLMRESILIGGMLTNSESWIKLTKRDLEDLEKPDMMLLRKVLGTKANPSKCFMQLELGVLPVKYVIMQRRMTFLHHILNQSTESMIHKVFQALKEDSRIGDFIALTNIDRAELNIAFSDIEIRDISKKTWKALIKKKVKELALTRLVEENSRKDKTRSIQFTELKMTQYLFQNERTSLSRLIFSVRSKTLDIKEWNPWSYSDNICIACRKDDETMDHFMICSSYISDPEKDWIKINGVEDDVIMKIAKAVETRVKERYGIIQKEEAGQTQYPDPIALD